MADNYRVGFIGTGRPEGSEGATGFGLAHRHADGYLQTGRCTLVANADLNAGLAGEFAAKYGVTAYTDYHKMLEAELDIVSISTWPHQHTPIVLDVARSGRVKAIHSEKPMATSWGDAKAMVQACEENGVQLTFDHQRRFLAPFQTAKKMLDAGAIGTLVQMQGNCSDLYDWGTHWLNMFFYYQSESPASWVMAQIDSRKDHTIFGVAMESQGLCEFQFADGVRAYLTTGEHSHEAAAHRLIGTEGMMEVRWDAPHLRLMNAQSGGWQDVQPGEMNRDGLHSWEAISRGIADLVDTLGTGREPLLSAKYALQSTEIIFAAYESSRRRSRVDLPLTVDDNAFLSMLNDGVIETGKKK